GAYYITTGTTGTESIIETGISTEGYTGIAFYFNHTSDGNDAGEYLAADWYNGTGWTNILFDDTNHGDIWQHKNYSLPAVASNNANFRIRFRALSSNPNEDFYVDDVEVFGSSAPILDILYPINGSTYNTPSLFIRTNITGNFLDTCWHNLNNGTNTTFTCNTEPNITAVEGLNNLTVYVNNTNSLVSQDSVNFYVNTSIPLTVQITSPLNNTISTSTSPKLKLLGYDLNYSEFNYTIYSYYTNGTLYSVGNNGTLTNGTETEITLSPALMLHGNLTSYYLIVNATDAGGNNATTRITYTITVPAVTLVSPLNNYWDNDGNISFNFRVLDEAYTNVSCSLYLDTILNQTNSSTLSDNTLTTFNVTGISEGANKVWEIICIDASTNTGQDTRTFNVDKTSPIINSINATPNPVNAGQLVNITANVTDNLGVSSVTVSVAGSMPYTMTSAGNNIYYYEYNTSGLSGNQSYNITAYDNALNNATSSGAISINTITINLYDYYGLNGSLGRVNEFNTSNLEEIEYMELNFSLNLFETGINNWYLNFTANGTDACALGNKQSSVCYNYTNSINKWIQFINGTNTTTYDGAQGNQGDRISVVQTGSGNNVNLSIRIDEHYNPNIFKWYNALYNFSDVKWQDGADVRISGNNTIKIEVNRSLVPFNADQYKMDIRVDASTAPIQPLNAWGCNSSYVSGNPFNRSECIFLASKYPSELQDDGTKFRSVFIMNASQTKIAGVKYVVFYTEEQNTSKYYAIKTYKATAPAYATHWERSNDSGDTWSNSGDGYETEFNVNWFYGGPDPTSFIYSLWINTTNGIQKFSEGNITWNIDPGYNYAPIIELLNTNTGDIISTPYNVSFITRDFNDDNLNVSLYLYQGGTLNQTLVTGLNENDTYYYWNSPILDGDYN
ncbi:MAG: Ig-like domain-containing protein, partial [Candidatus Peregrinibacteria bacterium]|nr:Ig-like domain-containing protein [Candidatus Peregrinibacteria bacterium]